MSKLSIKIEIDYKTFQVKCRLQHVSLKCSLELIDTMFESIKKHFPGLQRSSVAIETIPQITLVFSYKEMNTLNTVQKELFISHLKSPL